MSIPVDLILGNPDPALPFTNYSDLFTVIRQQLSASITDQLDVFVTGADTPAVDDQDKAWIRTDAEGRPLGTYLFFNGLWVREAPQVSGRFGFFTGDPTDIFDGDGAGLPGPGPVALDYFGWQLMNGQNGTPDLSDRFLIMAHMNDVDVAGYDDGWRTNITGAPLGTGGNSEITLDATNTYIPPTTDTVIVSPFSATGQARDDGGTVTDTLFGGTGDGSHTEFTLLDTTAGMPTPDAISIVNPFYALAIIQFTGYPS